MLYYSACFTSGIARAHLTLQIQRVLLVTKETRAEQVLELRVGKAVLLSTFRLSGNKQGN